MGSMANSEDPDEMQRKAAFHQGLHCLLRLKQPPGTEVHQGLHCFLRLKQPSGTEIHHNSETSNCDPLKYKMGHPIFIASMCMGKSLKGDYVNIPQVPKSQELDHMRQHKIRRTYPSGDKNISILHWSCKLMHLSLKSIYNKEHKGVICNMTSSSNFFQSTNTTGRVL